MVDSCCIDKKSSAELTEVVNSMFSYYYAAAECVIYLADVPGAGDKETQWQAISSCRWITRGWTLQELIASNERVFLADDWSEVKKQDRFDFLKMLAKATEIDWFVLRTRDRIYSYSVAERMSWASKRQTTRGEDRAYSLMGIFNINMPVIYGEGALKAFKRLQHEVMQITYDHTIFAWRGNYSASGLLEKSPFDFIDTPILKLWKPKHLNSWSMTSVGLLMKVQVIVRLKGKDQSDEFSWLFPHIDSGEQLAVPIQCDIKVGVQRDGKPQWHMLVIYLQSVPGVSTRVNGQLHQAYRRVRCADWCTIAAPDSHQPSFEQIDILMLDDDHFWGAGMAAGVGWGTELLPGESDSY